MWYRSYRKTCRFGFLSWIWCTLDFNIASDNHIQTDKISPLIADIVPKTNRIKTRLYKIENFRRSCKWHHTNSNRSLIQNYAVIAQWSILLNYLIFLLVLLSFLFFFFLLILVLNYRQINDCTQVSLIHTYLFICTQ